MGIVDRALWVKTRDEMLKKMLEDLEIGYLDPDIYHILQALFRRKESFPASSCSGRITVVDALMPWHRKASTVIFKKHSAVEEGEIYFILRSSPPISRLWLVATGPIFHISALTLREATSILKIAREAGMKHSGILSISKRGIFVELKTGIRVTNLLKSGSFVVEDIHEVVRVVNEALAEGKNRLARFYALLTASQKSA
ncbi:MAG: hypothetical protein RMI56_00295 [Sulfolobales archaeon]|nr:hypothetical protein [Sulfolobales archaeon]MDW8082219.1 hypothetical protein [Sulfolobales archaeon]